MYSGRETRPYLDKTLPEAGKAATAHATALSEEALRQGPGLHRKRIIKLRVPQLNGCLFLSESTFPAEPACRRHTREARPVTGVARRVPSASGKQPCSHHRSRITVAPEYEHQGEPVAAHSLLPDGTFVVAEWVAATINTFSRIYNSCRRQGHPGRSGRRMDEDILC